MPDALRGDGLVLAALPSTLTIRPESSGSVVFRLQDEQERPVHDYPIDFAILGQAVDGGVVAARLSTDRSLTNDDGAAAVQVIIDALAGGGHSAELFVQASAPGADATSVYVFVTTDTDSVEIVPLAAPEFVRAVSVDRTQLYFFDDSSCSDVDLASAGSPPIRSRSVKEAPAGGSAVFTGVSGQGAHAVVGLGLDSSNMARVGGCLDLPGGLLLENQTISATLLMDRLLPIPTGTYAVSSDLPLATPIPQPVAAIQSAWQEWARCPMDPARLLLDCAIDALVTNGTNDPNDCVPVPGGEGQLGGVLDARRGLVLSSVTATTTIKGATPCRDRVDGDGNVSLDALVDALFSDSRVALHNMNLEGLSSEIGALISSIHIDSTMRITADREPNTYIVDHELIDLAFPAATTPIALKVSSLGLPQPAADGVQASFSLGQLKFTPPHGFTLRLGTAAQYAFESTSLAKLRNAPNASDLVSAVVSMARFIDKGKVLTGCAALDATVCDQTGNPRGCLAGACRNGLDALARKLTDSFSNLDGNDLDLYLSGSAPVVDLNGDRRADALGIRSSTLAVGTGLWAAEVRSRAGSYSVYGSWAATRTGPAR
jgi:hypothetical protein